MLSDPEKNDQECVSRIGDAAVIALTGDINESKADKLGQLFHSLFDENTHKIILDMSQTRFISSTGLGCIMMAYKECAANGGYVRLVKPQPLIADILRITKLDSIFEIYDDIPTAVAGKANKPV